MADYRENPYRKDFPLLLEEKAAYLDNAATAQRPVCVMEARKSFMSTAMPTLFGGCTN